MRVVCVRYGCCVRRPSVVHGGSVLFVPWACDGSVPWSAAFVLSVGCTIVCDIYRCVSGMCAVIVWLMVSAPAISFQQQLYRTGGLPCWGGIRHQLCSLTQNQSEKSSKSLGDGSVSEISICIDCEQRPRLKY